MKNYWPLLIVALIAVGVFFAIGSQGDITGLAGPAKYNQYAWETVRPVGVIPNPVDYVPGQAFYVDINTLTKQDCIVGREVYHGNIMQGFIVGPALNELISACDAKGW
jgi:hypothetical protein